MESLPDDPRWTDEQLIEQMLAHPILINRPIVVTPKGVKLCRPSEAVLDLLPMGCSACVFGSASDVTTDSEADDSLNDQIQAR